MISKVGFRGVTFSLSKDLCVLSMFNIGCTIFKKEAIILGFCLFYSFPAYTRKVFILLSLS